MLWLLVFRLMMLAEATFQEDLESFFGIRKRKADLNSSETDIETSAIFCGDVPKKCEESKYRSYDGSCNNLEHSWWSSPLTAYDRLLPNTYSDGKYALPKSTSNEELPNPRTISNRLYVDVPKSDILWNLLFMQYGQVIAHDMSLTAGVSQTKKGAVVCCSQGKPTLAAMVDPRCAPIPIPKDDPFNAPEGITCMDFYRTETTKDRKCINATAVASPLTVVTSVLDMSFVYGNNEKDAMELREKSGGKMKSVTKNGKEFLPQDSNPMLTCNVKSATETCYKAGDVRVNQNPQLAVLHNMYHNQHNVIADEMAKLNPQWDDETTYQETRRIMIGMYQHITYNEFLPPLLGKQAMLQNGLIYESPNGYKKDYDRGVCPSVYIEFSSAAFRFFHTEIVGNIQLYNENRNISSTITLREWMDRPSICEVGNNFDELTRGLLTQAQSAEDRFMTNDILNFLFEYTGKNGLALDLKTIDIARSREHGCGTYVQALKYCGLADPKGFQDFSKFMSIEKVKTLESIYKSYLDVDLIVGISLENILPNALCGATSQCIMIKQFKKTRIGDSYFFENGNGKCRFKSDQLAEIRKATIASFICSNPNIKRIQKEAFKLISPTNPLVKCRDIPKFNATPWKNWSC